MKQEMKRVYKAGIAAAIVILCATSCKKEASVGTDTSAGATVATTSTSSTIAVAASNGTTTTSGSTDSVYVIHNCERGTHRDSVAAASLPATVQTYLTTNYSGYSFMKAFAVKDTAGTVAGYVVIINYNNKPVGLLFKADGTFVRVLEQREKGDLNNDGWHRGGRFECRDGQHRDSVAVASLPSVVTSYMSQNYPTDTLVNAFRLENNGYVVLSRNGGLFATVFTSAGVFVNRVALPAPGAVISAAVATLPSAALSYLTTTYPNYVLDKTFSVSVNGTVKGYVALINANNTRYCVAFDASGSFIAAKTIW